MQDLHSSVKYLPAIIPQTQTNSDTAIVGEIIDLQGSRGCEIVLVTGVITDADVTVAITIEEGNASNLAGSNAVASSDISGTLAGAALTFASDKVCTKFGYVGTKRYIRVTATPTGNNSGALPIAAVAALWMMKGPQA